MCVCVPDCRWYRPLSPPTLKFPHPNALQFAGLVVALRHGLFTKKGLDVVLRGAWVAGCILVVCVSGL